MLLPGTPHFFRYSPANYIKDILQFNLFHKPFRKVMAPTELVTLGQATHFKDDCFADPWKPHETILIQHGFGRHSNFWYHWVPKLSGKYRVIRRDARGHGKSSAPAEGDTSYDWSLDTMLREIIDMLDQLKLEKVHFLGESTSGIGWHGSCCKVP